jgi:hypothetical protein
MECCSLVLIPAVPATICYPVLPLVDGDFTPRCHLVLIMSRLLLRYVVVLLLLLFVDWWYVYVDGLVSVVFD